VIGRDAIPGVGETANARNLRILQQELDERSNPRTASYLGNTYKDRGR